MDKQPLMTAAQKQLLLFSCLILVTGLMAMDFINPSLPFIMEELQISQSATKGLMVEYLIALSFAQFFYGIYSDTYGRKSTIIISILIAIAGFILSGLSHNIGMLYIGRFLTAIGTAGCPVIARALISDVFSNKTQLKQAFAYFTMSSQFSPAFAPILGGIIQNYANWHWAFLTLALFNGFVILTIYFLMPETCEQRSLKKSVQNQLRLYSQYSKQHHFILFSVQSALVFVYTIVYYSLSPFIFHLLGYTAMQNGLFYAIYAVGMVLGSWFVVTWLKMLDAKRTFMTVIILYPVLFIFSTIIFSLSQIGPIIAVFSLALGLLCGIAAPLTLFLCMEGLTENKGAASAIQGFIKMLFPGLALLACNFLQLTHFSELMMIFFAISVLMASLFYIGR